MTGLIRDPRDPIEDLLGTIVDCLGALGGWVFGVSCREGSYPLHEFRSWGLVRSNVAGSILGCFLVCCSDFDVFGF